MIVRGSIPGVDPVRGQELNFASCLHHSTLQLTNMTFDILPVELVVSVLEELDLQSLVTMSELSRRLREIISDPFLNPWRQPIARILADDTCSGEPLLRHITERSTVPRQNAIDILILAPPAFILFDFTIPNLKQADWEMIFRKRFLPGWDKWKRDLSWREVYKRSVSNVLCDHTPLSR